MFWLIVSLVLVTLRLVSLFISKRNYKKLMASGATEYGTGNSIFLAVCHTLFYGACFFEGYGLTSSLTLLQLTGAGLLVFSFIMLGIVIRQLSPFWTIKLVISPEHRLNQSFLFKHVRHPNYFLNILPELVGLALFYGAHWTLVIGFPVYLIPLITRIKQEEAVMKETFNEYASG